MERSLLSNEIFESYNLKLGFLTSGRDEIIDDISRAIERNSLNAKSEVVISNTKHSDAFQTAQKHQIPFSYISSLTNPQNEYEYTAFTLQEYGVKYVIDAGYKKQIKKPLLEAFSNRIIGIFPSVHSEYINQRMDEKQVHQKVICDGKLVSGYIIYLLDGSEEISQESVLASGFVRVKHNETPGSLKDKVNFEARKGLIGLLKNISEPNKLQQINLPRPIKI